MTITPVRIAHVGLGAIGREVVRLVLRRPDLALGAVCDISPALVGASLASILEENLADDLTVMASLGALPGRAASGPLVVTHTTTSSLAVCLPELLAAVEARAHVVSSCEDRSYPWVRAPELAARLDAAA